MISNSVSPESDCDGLVAYWDNVEKTKYPVDISVLGCNAPDTSFEASTDWIDVNTDGMYLGGVLKKVVVPHCLPVGVGGGRPFFKYIDQFIEGFQNQSHELIRLKTDLLSDSGPIMQLKGIKKRIVLRPTATYFHLSELLLAPEVCSNTVNQGLALEVLSRSFIECSLKNKHIWKVFKSEVKQLSRLDIPYFYHLTDDTIIYSEDGKVADLSNNGALISGHEKCVEKLTNLSQEDIDFQASLITGIAKQRFS